MADIINVYGEVHRDKPGVNTDTSTQSLQQGRRGELLVQALGKPRYRLADEGSLFVVTNAVPGTGVDGVAGTGAFSAAESFILVRNTATTAEGHRVYLDSLRLTLVTAGTNGTNVRYVSNLDTGASRFTSGQAGALHTAVNPNMASSATPSAAVYVGALVTTTATSSVRLVSQGQIRTVIGVAGDVYTFNFGGDPVPSAGMIAEGTAQAHIVIDHPPVVLGPTDQLVLSIHHAAQTVASNYEYELRWWER